MLIISSDKTRISVFISNNKCYQNYGCFCDNVEEIISYNIYLCNFWYRTVRCKRCTFCNKFNDLFLRVDNPICVDCFDIYPDFNIKISTSNVLKLDNSILYYDSKSEKGLFLHNNTVCYMRGIEINTNHQYKLYENINGPGFCQKCYRRCFTFYCENCNKYFQLLMINENCLSLFYINNIELLPELVNIIKNLWFIASFCVI
jgi:hypothetical protein